MTKNTQINEHVTSGRHISHWLYDSPAPLKSEKLETDLETDAVIIGGGIAGLTVAYCMLEAGKKIVLLEDGFIGSGETGHTTAHLTNALDDRYYHLEKVFGEKNLKLIAESHSKAIEKIAEIVSAEQIACDFKRVNGYLFLHPSDKKESLEKEMASARKAGLNVIWKDAVPGMPQHIGPCLEFADQAQFHPMKYISGLCKAILEKGGKIFTETRAEEIKAGEVKVSGWHKIKAKHVIVATNTPVNNRVAIHVKQFPYRTYVITARIAKGSLDAALWWDTGDQEINSSMPPYHYVRTQPLDDQYDLLICGGEDHSTGLADAEDVLEEQRYARLEEWAKNNFGIGEVWQRWSGQVMEPMDSLGYIGRNPMDDDEVYIVTGDSGNGMTHATIAGMLITDLACGRKNPWEEIYDPSRMKWLSTGGVFFKEFVGGLVSYMRHKPDTDTRQIYELQKDEGKVLDWHGRTCGVYRDKDDTLHVVDASCTHLQCTVKWNNDERSWDCPCHGSRFTTEGKVINGPANRDLPHHSEVLRLDNELIT